MTADQLRNEGRWAEAEMLDVVPDRPTTGRMFDVDPTNPCPAYAEVVGPCGLAEGHVGPHMTKRIVTRQLNDFFEESDAD